MRRRRQENYRTRIYVPEFGKVPPQATDIESAVLGICMVYPDAVHNIKLKPEMFYKDAHQKIYGSILELSKTGKLDLMTVTNQLRSNGHLESVGGPLYLTSLIEPVITDSMLESYAMIVKDKFIKREIIRITSEIQMLAYDEMIDTIDVREHAESSIFNIFEMTHTSEPTPISGLIDGVLNEINDIVMHKKEFTGIPSGYPSVDNKTGGWMPGSLVIIAGRPGMGKTALALALAQNATNFKHKVGFFSLEMGATELVTRLISSETSYTNTEIRTGRDKRMGGLINMDHLCRAGDKLFNMPLYVDDTPALDIYELRSKVKKLIIKYKIEMVVVDYLQLMKADADSREQEVSAISRGLKAIAKEFHVPVIALSQLNRQVEERAGKRPQLSDLRESGAIEQDADIVCFVYRPSYYNISTVRLGDEEIDSTRRILLLCEKNRNGATFDVALYHNESLTRITENNPLNESVETKTPF